MDKHTILLESVRKLLALEGITEKDITDNLKEVGVTESEAKALILEARNELPTPMSQPASSVSDSTNSSNPVAGFKKARPTKEFPLNQEPSSIDSTIESIPNVPESELTEEELIGAAKTEVETKPVVKEQSNSSADGKSPEDLFTRKMVDDIVSDKPVSKPKTEPVIETKVKPSFYEQVMAQSTSSSYNNSSTPIWDQAILTTVDQKLEEMRRIRNDIEVLLEQKVEEKMDAEREKTKALFDAQKTLFSSKISSELKNKTQEVDDLLNVRLKEFKTLNDSIQKNIASYDAKKQMTMDLLSSVSEKLADVDTTKRRMVQEMSSELSTIKQQNETFLQEAGKRLLESDSRITKTLELESRVAEGLVKNADLKIEDLINKRMQVLEQRVNQRLIELADAEKKIDFKNLDNRINNYQKQLDTLDAFKDDIAILQKQLQDVDSIKERFLFLSKSAQELETKLSDFKEFRNQFLQLQNDAESFKQSVKEFSAFKEQFINTVQKNTEKLNVTIKEFNDSRQKIEKTINDKMSELDAFEQNFAKEMGLQVESLIAKQEKEKSSKASLDDEKSSKKKK